MSFVSRVAAPNFPRPPARRILVTGPSLDQVGGMATVIQRMLAARCPGFEFQFLPDTSNDGRISGGAYRPGRLLRSIARHVRHFACFIAAIRHRDIVAVHLHTCSGISFYRASADLLAALLLGKKALLHVHGARFDRFAAEARAIGRPFIRWILGCANRVIALSLHWEAELRRICPEARIVVLRNAVALSAFPTPLPPGDRRVRFLFAARMDEWKGVDDLLAAAEVLTRRGYTDFELVLAGPAGSAGDAAVLNAKIEQFGLINLARYVGPLTSDQVQRALEATHVHVQPSHHEGLPMAVLEAMAAGRPVIATRVGALPEVIRDGVEGLLVPPRTPTALADAMESLLDSPKRRTAMGAAGYERIKDSFSLERFEAELGAMYHALLESPDLHAAAPSAADRERCAVAANPVSP